MAYGRWFEEFTVGEVIKHWPGRTITEADCTWFALLTMNQHPLHSDAHYAATHTQHGQARRAGPARVLDRHRHDGRRRLRRVMTFTRTALLPKRSHPTLGEGVYPA